MNILRTALAVSVSGTLTLAGATAAHADDPAPAGTKPVIISTGLTDGQLIAPVVDFRPTVSADTTRIDVGLSWAGNTAAYAKCQHSTLKTELWSCRINSGAKSGLDLDAELTVQAFDAAGTASDPVTLRVHMDTKAPASFNLTPRFIPSPRRSGPVTVAFTDLSDDVAAVLVLDGPNGKRLETITGAPWSYTWNATSEGKAPSFVAIDAAGNGLTHYTNYEVDDDAPVIDRVDFTGYYRSSRLDTGTGWLGATGVITPTISDKTYIARSEWRLDGVLVPELQAWNSRFSPTTAAELELRVWDGAGNSAAASFPVYVDKAKPALTFKKVPKNKSKLSTTVSLTATATDRSGIVKVQMLVNGKVVATDAKSAYAFSLNPKKYGKTFTVQLRAIDRAGYVTYSPKLTYRR